MKPTTRTIALLLGLSLSTGLLNAQDTDSTGLPGDNFSLQAALEMFKDAGNPQAFEQALNTEGNAANNLDLNDDGETDYLKVIDKQDGDVHMFILQVAVSGSENQDIAVIEVEKTGDNTAVLQIVGDEDIYGEETIVEPAEEGASWQHGNASFDNYAVTRDHGPLAGEAPPIVVNVWYWPSVRYVYAPGYVLWHSPYRWAARPAWWRPWRPVRYAVFYPRRAVYRPRYVVAHTHRVARARTIYRPVRVTSVTVVNRNATNVGRYRATSATRTTVTGPRGQVKKTTTTVTGPRGGKVKTTNTRVRRRR